MEKKKLLAEKLPACRVFCINISKIKSKTKTSKHKIEIFCINIIALNIIVVKLHSNDKHSN